jgi:hypothetical protein
MSRELNTLDEWLAISIGEHPADNYRLLGLAAFEPNVAVIAEAVRIRIAQVDKLGGGPRAEQVIERLRAAEHCLKTPETKAAYDRLLRTHRAVPTVPKTASKWRPWLLGLACSVAAVTIVVALASRRKSDESTLLKPDEPKLLKSEVPTLRSDEPTRKSEEPHADAAKANASKQPESLVAKTSEATVSPPEPVVLAASDNRHNEHSGNGRPRGWLPLDGGGEPFQATLADGTVLKLDTYGEKHEAWHVVPPLGANEVEAVVDYQRDRLVSNWGLTGLRLDVAAGKMYWIEIGTTQKANIRRAGLDGKKPARLLDLTSQHPRGLALDPQRGKMYWGTTSLRFGPPNSGQPGRGPFGSGPEAQQALWRAGLDGSHPAPLFTALRHPEAVAIEPKSGTVYYFEELRLMRGGADGKNEAPVIERLVLSNNRGRKASCATIDAKHGKIYWCEAIVGMARANLDGTGFESVPAVGRTCSVGIDMKNDKLYWSTSKEVWRANLDGSLPELVVNGIQGGTVLEIDSEGGYIYFGDRKFSKGDVFGMIRRMKIPPLAFKETTPAPPLILSIPADAQRPGANVEVRGKHFRAATHVRVIGDDGRQSDAQFKVVDDSKLTFVLPPRREGVKRFAVVVQGPGGVTVTLPRDTHSVKRGNAPFVNFDRARDGDKFCFAVNQDAHFAHVEKSLVYVTPGGAVMTQGRGNVVLFLKNGSEDKSLDAEGIVVYHEPHAKIIYSAHKEGHYKYIPVPAIRPSFVESLLKYEPSE